jgi:CRISPR/Cas system-associated endonuclease Cas1
MRTYYILATVKNANTIGTTSEIITAVGISITSALNRVLLQHGVVTAYAYEDYDTAKKWAEYPRLLRSY